MRRKIYFTNVELLQQAKVIFETVEQNADVAEKVDEYSFGAYGMAGVCLHRIDCVDSGNVSLLKIRPERYDVVSLDV